METRKPSNSNPCGKKKRFSAREALAEIFHDSDSGEEDSDSFECDDDVEAESENDESEEVKELQPPPAKRPGRFSSENSNLLRLEFSASRHWPKPIPATER